MFSTGYKILKEDGRSRNDWDHLTAFIKRVNADIYIGLKILQAKRDNSVASESSNDFCSRLDFCS